MYFHLVSVQNQQAQNADGSLIPQISINPWDPSQGVQMTLASPALAMQLLQANQRQQWLAAQWTGTRLRRLPPAAVASQTTAV